MMTLYDYCLLLAAMTDEELEAEKRRRPAALTPCAEWDAIQWERRARRMAAGRP